MGFEFVLIGNVGMNWVRSVFQDPTFIGTQLLESSCMPEGRAFAILDPSRPSPATLDVGGVDCEGGADALLVAMLQFNLVVKNMSIVFEHPLGRRGDAFLEKWHQPAIFRDDIPYVILHPKDGSSDNILNSMNITNTAGSFQLYVVRDGGLVFQDNGFDIVHEKIEAVICGAYDGESYVWLDVSCDEKR